MDNTEELKQWFDLAEQNLRFAKNGATTMHPMPVETICNLCQQTEEDANTAIHFADEIKEFVLKIIQN